MAERTAINNFSLDDSLKQSTLPPLISDVIDATRQLTIAEGVKQGKEEAEAEYQQEIERLQREKEIAEKNSITDPLTNLLNRRGWIENIAHIDTRRGDTATIIVFDVNGLKETNDNFGHSQGDILIKNSASYIESVFKRSQDQIFSFQSNDQIDSLDPSRTGGDEFAVLVKGIKTIEDKQNLEKFIKNSFSPENQKNAGINVAYGIAHFDPEVDTQGLDFIKRESGKVYETTLDRADKAMYENKKEQKRQKNFFSQSSVSE